jgi:hypothetical protein
MLKKKIFMLTDPKIIHDIEQGGMTLSIREPQSSSNGL